MADKEDLDIGLEKIARTRIGSIALDNATSELIFKWACERKGGTWSCKTKWIFFRVCNCTPKTPPVNRPS